MAQHRETAKHQLAFETWYAADRDFDKAGQSLTVSSQTVRNWASWFGWEARADKRDREAAERADREAVKRRAEMLKRHRQAAELLTRRGIEHLAKKEIDATRDAITAIKTGVELERQAEGLPAWAVEILNADEQQLRRRLAELDARIAGLAPAAGTHPESAGDALAVSGVGEAAPVTE